jgi:hypothetical protein
MTLERIRHIYPWGHRSALREGVPGSAGSFVPIHTGSGCSYCCWECDFGTINLGGSLLTGWSYLMDGCRVIQHHWVAELSV